MFVIVLLVWVACAFIGGSMAKSQGRDPALWAIICLLTGVVGIVILAIVGEDKSKAANATYAAPNSGYQPPVSLPKPAPVVEAAKYDIAKWRTLTEIDPDIGEANRRISEHGQQYTDALATKYLTLSDKSYLAAIVDNVLDQVRKDAAERERIAQENAQLAAEGRLKGAVFFQEYVARLKQNDGNDPDSGRRVKRVVVYEGKARIFEGEAIKIVFDDGSALLRGRNIKRPFKSEEEADAWGQ